MATGLDGCPAAACALVGGVGDVPYASLSGLLLEKPDRRVFEHALGLIDLAPARVVHVGDDMGCATAPDVTTLAARIEAARA